MTRNITIRNPGALSLVQDSGRDGFQRYGVSVSGAVDPEALLIGNLLVDNGADEAAIEVTFGGAEFMFNHDVIVAVTGGDLQPSLDGTTISMWESFLAPAGSVLRLEAPVTGLRSYVAVDGGVSTTAVLGSRSTHVASGLGGLSGGPLAQGDELPLGDGTGDSYPGARFPDELRLQHRDELTVRVIAGPQETVFTSAGVESFYNSSYTVTESSDRQGLRLDGPVIEATDGRYDIVSDAVVFGAIQVPGDGKPIVLLADRQTTGGYAKIGVVATVDLPLLAQALPGSVIRFEEIGVSDAQRLLRERTESIISADLSRDLRSVYFPISIAGIREDVAISFRDSGLSEPQGTLATIELGGVNSTVRVQEIV